MKRKSILILSAVTASAIGVGIALMNPLKGQPPELNADCTVRVYETTEITAVKYRGIDYRLIEGKDRYGIRRLNVVEDAPDGCKLLAGPTDDILRVGEVVPEDVAKPFAIALWEMAIDEMGQEAIEELIATSTIGRELNSIDVFSEDIYAWKELGIKYPDYIKALDSFETPQAADAYYNDIFNEQWHKENPQEGHH